MITVMQWNDLEFPYRAMNVSICIHSGVKRKQLRDNVHQMRTL